MKMTTKDVEGYLKSLMGLHPDTTVVVEEMPDRCATVISIEEQGKRIAALVKQSDIEDNAHRAYSKAAEAMSQNIMGVDPAAASSDDTATLSIYQGDPWTITGLSAPTTTFSSAASGTYFHGTDTDGEDQFEMNGRSISGKIRRVLKSGEMAAIVGQELNDTAIVRIAREIVRVIREVDDDTFEKADVNPEYHRENFIKVIDAVMREL